jgi:enoyl-CoA hydratase/carnithine racemase
MPDELIAVQDGPVARLTLNRPAQRNALTPELIAELLAQLERFEADRDTRVLVLTGAGEAFCAGFDITRIESPGGPAAGRERDLVETLCSRVQAHRLPVVARVNGVASGAGCDLAVSCDVRIASSTARFAMPPARLGLLYSYEGMARLVSVAGPAAAKELLLGAQLFDADRALACRLVNRVVPGEHLDEETERFVQAVAANAPLSVAAAKLVVNLVADGAALPPGALAAIEEASSGVWASEDSKEGPRAFRERRAPRFSGR